MILVKDMDKNTLIKHGVNLDEVAKYFGDDIEYIFFDENNLIRFLFLDHENYINIPLFQTIDINYLIQSNFLKTITYQRKENKKLINNNEFEELFYNIDKQFLFKAYKNLYNLIPDKLKYPIFRIAYTISEYGFNELEDNFIYEIFSYNKDREFLKELSFDNEGCLTIYRGESSKSNDVYKSYSWTINIEKALFFANRFDTNNSKIYKSKIYKDYIIDYITYRNEDEILLLPKYLKNIEKYK